ncbi:AMP-binding protein [Amycolatopsis sp. NPDC005003]
MTAYGRRTPYLGSWELFGAETLPAVLAQAASRGYGGITVIDSRLRETPLPYGRLVETARRAAGGLARLGVGRGDRVALISPTSPALLACLFGAWSLGAVPAILPLPPRSSQLGRSGPEFGRRLAHIGATCTVVADAFAELASGDLGRRHRLVRCGELLTESREESAPPPPDPHPDDVAYLQFTSGTTGSPRAVTLTHRQLLANAALCCTALAPNPLDSLHVSWLPLFHDMGLVSTIGGIAHGVRLVLQPTESFVARPDSWLDALSTYRATSTVAPHFAYELAAKILKLRPRELDLSALRVCGNGAEAIDRDSVAEFLAATTPYGLSPRAITPMYGLAEATLAVTIGDGDEPRWDHVDRNRLERDRIAAPVPETTEDVRSLAVCGRPLPGVSVEIRDAHGNALPERTVGEITVRSPSLMRGYWNEPEATAEILRDGWLHTGDLGYLVPDGLVVCGRIKDVIIVGGRNIHPEEYEHVTTAVPGARPVCAAFGVPGRERMVVAFEMRKKNDSPHRVATAVLAALRERIGHAPDAVVALAPNTIPRTTSGKVQRSLCAERYLSGQLPVLAEVSG